MTKYLTVSPVQDRTESQFIVCSINLIIAYHCMAHNVSVGLLHHVIFSVWQFFGTPMPSAHERDGNAEMCVGERGWSAAAEDRNTFL